MSVNNNESVHFNSGLDAMANRPSLKAFANAVAAKVSERPAPIDFDRAKRDVERDLRITPAQVLYDRAEAALNQELAKADANMEELIYLFCRLQMLLNRMTQNQSKDYIKELKDKISAELEKQIEAKATPVTQGSGYAVAGLQISAALGGGEALSLAGRALDSLNGTWKTSNSTYETRHAFNVDDLKRIRDESAGNKNRADQQNNDLLQLFQRAMESSTRAKTAQAA